MSSDGNLPPPRTITTSPTVIVDAKSASRPQHAKDWKTETIKLSAIKSLSPTHQRYQSALCELDFEAHANENYLTKAAVSRLLTMHPIGVTVAPGGDSGSRVLVFGLRSFQIAACCLKSEDTIEVTHVTAASQHEIDELALADIVIGTGFHATRSDALGMTVAVHRRIEDLNEMECLARLLPNSDSIDALASFLRRTRKTLYERHDAFVRGSQRQSDDSPKLTPLGLRFLMQAHPIGVTKRRPRKMLFGWRAARIVLDALAKHPRVTCRTISPSAKTSDSEYAIADLMIGNPLYSLRASTIPSLHHLYERLSADGRLPELKAFADGIETRSGFAAFFGINRKTLHYRASPERQSKLLLTSPGRENKPENQSEPVAEAT